MSTTSYWLVKQEPTTYSFEQFLKEKITAWTGIRNYQARNNLRAMQKGDTVFFYHSNVGKAIVGLAQVASEFYPDPTDPEWDCINLKAIAPLPTPLHLTTIKADPLLSQMPLVTQPRLSVMPITAPQARKILKLTKADL
jgi:predicted RNA-binding protein with PUA-like domain